LDEPSRLGERFGGWEFEFLEHFKTLLEDREVLPGQGDLFIPYGEFLAKLGDFNQVALQALPKSVPELLAKGYI
jgi:hypothetical protein